MENYIDTTYLLYGFAGLGLVLFAAFYYLANKRKVLVAHWIMLLGLSALFAFIAHSECFYWLVPALVPYLLIYPILFFNIKEKSLGWICAGIGLVVVVSSYLIAHIEHGVIISLLFTVLSLSAYGISVAAMLAFKCKYCGWYGKQVELNKEEILDSFKTEIKPKRDYKDGVPYKAELCVVETRKFKVTQKCPNCGKVYTVDSDEEKVLPGKVYYADGKETICGLCALWEGDKCQKHKQQHRFEDASCKDYAIPEPEPEAKGGSSSGGSGSIFDSIFTTQSSFSVCGHCCYFHNNSCSYGNESGFISFSRPACHCYSPG